MVLIMVVLMTTLAIHRPVAAADARRSFFHSIEIRSDKTKAFQKWNSAVVRYAREQNWARGQDCRNDGSVACVYAELDAFLDTLRGKSRHEQLVAVNALMNAQPYTPDAKNWGEKDYWATPAEFMARSGDCEDFAIAKFFALKRLGWSANTLRLAAVKDLDRGEGHAVLVAFDGAKSWMLDNQIKQVVETNTVRHYEAVYSINENFWWRHKVMSASRSAGVQTSTR
jgi:predicted transglutaminase-like cysteine proteinase